MNTGYWAGDIFMCLSLRGQFNKGHIEVMSWGRHCLCKSNFWGISELQICSVAIDTCIHGICIYNAFSRSKLYGGSVFAFTLQKILELLLWNIIAITQGINFVGIMKVKLAFCMGKLRVKWLKSGAFPQHLHVLLTIGSASPGGHVLQKQPCREAFWPCWTF